MERITLQTTRQRVHYTKTPKSRKMSVSNFDNYSLCSFYVESCSSSTSWNLFLLKCKYRALIEHFESRKWRFWARVHFLSIVPFLAQVHFLSFQLFSLLMPIPYRLYDIHFSETYRIVLSKDVPMIVLMKVFQLNLGQAVFQWNLFHLSWLRQILQRQNPIRLRQYYIPFHYHYRQETVKDPIIWKIWWVLTLYDVSSICVSL